MNHTGSIQPAVALACALLGAAAAEAGGLKTLGELRSPTQGKEIFVYKQEGGRDLTLDVYPVGERFPAVALPAIVFVHGGCWNSGSTDHFAPHCRYFASRGVVAVNDCYRLTQGYFPGRPGGIIFDAIAHVQDAVRWLRASAARLGIDTKRIAAAGDSAGGHLAAAILPDPRTGKVDPAAVPDALVLCNPVLDLEVLA